VGNEYRSGSWEGIIWVCLCMCPGGVEVLVMILDGAGGGQCVPFSNCALCRSDENPRHVGFMTDDGLQTCDAFGRYQQSKRRTYRVPTVLCDVLCIMQSWCGLGVWVTMSFLTQCRRGFPYPSVQLQTLKS